MPTLIDAAIVLAITMVVGFPSMVAVFGLVLAIGIVSALLGGAWLAINLLFLLLRKDCS